MRDRLTDLLLVAALAGLGLVMFALGATVALLLHLAG
jgi:hypothetical protein